MSAPVAGRRLRLELGPAAAAAAAGDGRLLTVAYGAAVGGHRASGPPWLDVPNRVLGGGPGVEVWRSPRTVRHGDVGGLPWAADGELAAGCLSCPAASGLEAAARVHFARLLAALAELGYPHLLRVWNYVPQINVGAGDRERYREFNAGRAAAFAAAGWSARDYPASSAVGTAGERLLTAWLASAAPPRHFENPRQVAAHRYPLRYGPRAPTFSRATCAPASLGGAFFLSGTASVVGHASRHPGAAAAQLAETLRNVDAVRAAVRCGGGAAAPPLADFDLVKVYLREPADLAVARASLAPALRPATPTLWLAADICRAELLLELEGCALG